jgi:hypothetical protein
VFPACSFGNAALLNQRSNVLKGRLGMWLLRAAVGLLFVTIPASSFLLVCFHSHRARRLVVFIEPHCVMLLLLSAVAFALWRRRSCTHLPIQATDSAAFSRHYLLTCLALSATMILFFIPLIRMWTAPFWDGSTLCGLVPFSDAASYYDGAMHLQYYGELNAWNCRRPLNALLLAVRLFITGGELRGALLIQAALAAVAAFCLARVLARDFGKAAALMAIAIVFSLAQPYLPLSLSEALGLTMGTLATALLWAGAREQHRMTALGGMFLMTVALNARAGAFFVLPALVLWFGLAFKHEARFSFRSAGMGLGVVAMAFIFNSTLLWAYSSGAYAAHGNFGHVLYGLTTGFPDWGRIYIDHPEAYQFSEQELSSFCYQKSWENIGNNPFMLAKGLFNGALIWARGLANYIVTSLHITPWRWVNILFIILLLGSSIKLLWTARHTNAIRLSALGIAGFLISGPIIFPDGLERCLVAAAPLFFAIPAAAVGAFSRKAWSYDESSPAQAWSSLSTFPATVAATILVAALIGPWIVIKSDHTRQTMPAVSERDVLLKVGPVTPHIALLPSGGRRSTFAPGIHVNDFMPSLRGSYVLPLPGLDPSTPDATILVFAYNLNPANPQCLYVSLPKGIIQDRWRYLRIANAPKLEGWLWYCDGATAEVVE